MSDVFYEHPSWRIGTELTFVPRATKTFRSRGEANKVIKRLGSLIRECRDDLRRLGIDLVFKPEPFRIEHWIIEAGFGASPPTLYIWNSLDFQRLMRLVFASARKVGLVPRVRTPTKHWPAGGNHIHLCINGLFPDDTYFLANLAAFERNLYVDFVNRPYIRWLFDEWFDEDTNASVVTPNELNSRGQRPDAAYIAGRQSYSICPRFSMMFKNPYSSYEFRCFDMVDTVDDLLLTVRFVAAWAAKLVGSVNLGIVYKQTLSPDYFARLRNTRFAWREIQSFLLDLGLEPRQYRHMFKDNYIPRAKWGKML